MDKQDKEFEAYLRQFRLRQPGPPPEIASASRRSSMGWLLVAAVVVLAVGISAVLVRNYGNGSGPKATVEAAGSPSLYRVGETIEAGQTIQSNSAVGLMLTLEDGSHIEMREQSELKLESAGDGIRVRLSDGSVIVTAVKQAAGRHLYVQTRDALVSVVGTVFFVNAEQSGTTVAVVEGEVHVQQGEELKKLLPGEQMATNSKMQLKPVAEQISWSRRAAEYVALLQQPATPVAPLAADPVAVSPGAAEPEVVRPAQLPFQVQAYYAKAASEQVRTMITIQILNRDLAFLDVGGGKIARAHISGVIHRIDNRRLPEFSDDVLVEFPSKTFAAALDQPTVFQETQYLDPGRYKLHITLEDSNAQRIGVQEIALNVPRILDQSLQASSMILAYSITYPPPLVLGSGEIRVRPNASGVFRTSENMNVWQEIYGLIADSASLRASAAFELVISQDKKEIRKLTFTSSDRLGPGQSLTYTKSVPMVGFNPGLYDVQLKVTDNLAKASFVSTGRFTVAGSAVQSEPRQITSGKQVFDRECTSCHNADVAMRPLSYGQPVRTSSMLASAQAELAELLMKGLARQHPEVQEVQARLSALLKMEAAIKNDYSSFVLSHLSKFGGTISGAGFPALVEYVYGETIRTAEAQGASVPQDRPVTPPAAPVQPNDKDAPKEDPDVAGARILNSACTGCHDLGAVTGRKEDRASWERIVNGMVGYGAGVKDSEFPVLVDYLFRHYGPPKEAPAPPVRRP